jgi:hypothetical protein
MIATRFGEPICFGPQTSKTECGKQLFESLRRTQRELAQSVIRRDFDEFDFLIPPKAQRQGLYDTMRAWKSWIQGRPFDPSHASVTRKHAKEDAN